MLPGDCTLVIRVPGTQLCPVLVMPNAHEWVTGLILASSYPPPQFLSFLPLTLLTFLPFHWGAVYGKGNCGDPNLVYASRTAFLRFVIRPSLVHTAWHSTRAYVSAHLPCHSANFPMPSERALGTLAKGHSPTKGGHTGGWWALS